MADFTALSDVRILAGAAVVLLALLLLGLVMRRRRSGDPEARLRAVAAGVLADFVIPDGDAGEIQVEFALLTEHGIIVLDLKDVEGHVFGSETMQDWTVIQANRRFTFGNPQHALLDRVAAVKRVVPEIPVTGFVAFMERARFTKGRPRYVVQFDEFLRELEKERQRRSESPITAFLPYWDRLREVAVTTQVGHLLQR